MKPRDLLSMIFLKASGNLLGDGAAMFYEVVAPRKRGMKAKCLGSTVHFSDEIRTKGERNSKMQIQWT